MRRHNLKRRSISASAGQPYNQVSMAATRRITNDVRRQEGDCGSNGVSGLTR